MVAICARITWLPKSNSCASVSLLLDIASWMIGTRRGVVLENQRRLHPGRHVLQRQLAEGRHLRHGEVDVDARLEEQLDDRHAGIRLRLDVLDVVDDASWRSARSAPVMRPAISSGGMPVYWKVTAMIGNA